MEPNEIEAAATKVGHELVDMIFDKAQAEGIPGDVMVIAMIGTLTSVIKGAARTPEAYAQGLAWAHRWIGDRLAETTVPAAS